MARNARSMRIKSFGSSSTTMMVAKYFFMRLSDTPRQGKVVHPYEIAPPSFACSPGRCKCACQSEPERPHLGTHTRFSEEHFGLRRQAERDGTSPTRLT